MKFEDLPQNYQDSINNSIKEWTKDTEVIAINAFKESVTEHLNDCAISELDIIDEDEFAGKLLWFLDGWKRRDIIKNPIMF